LGRLSVARAERPLPWWGVPLAWLGMSGVLAFAALPHAGVVLLAVSRRWSHSVLPGGFTLEFFQRAVGSELTQTALWNSLILSVSASVLIVVMGFAIAWLGARARVRGAALLDTLAMMPLAVPGIVVAFGYLSCFGGPLIPAFLDPRSNPMALLAVGYTIRRLPFMVRAVHAGLEQTSRTYEEAAANLGATPWRVIRRVTIPLISANLVAGVILCFTFSMLEVSDSMILAQSKEYYPITKALYTLLEGLENGVNMAAALGVWAMALLAAGLLWASALLGRKMGQMFRAG